MRVGSASPEAFLTEKDVDFLVSQRKTADIARIYTLEDELMVQKGLVLKLMLDLEVMKDRDKKSAERIGDLLKDRKNLRNTMMDLQASNAKLAKENNQGKRIVDEQLKEVIRELNELKGASSSSSEAKRPRI